jgi:hypothetical protein
MQVYWSYELGSSTIDVAMLRCCDVKNGFGIFRNADVSLSSLSPTVGKPLLALRSEEHSDDSEVVFALHKLKLSPTALPPVCLHYSPEDSLEALMSLAISPAAANLRYFVSALKQKTACKSTMKPRTAFFMPFSPVPRALELHSLPKGGYEDRSRRSNVLVQVPL